MATSFTATYLTRGVTYEFKVAARNTVGYSLQSTAVTILAAQMPDQPDPPVTTLNGENVEISWNEPGTGGSPVTFYQITVLQNDGVTYRPDLTNCDGSDPTIFANRMCSIPVLYLKASPFFIEWAGSVYAKVVAVNIYGHSEASDPGNGAKL